MEDQTAPVIVTDELLVAWSLMADAEAPHRKLGAANWVMIVRSLIAEIRRRTNAREYAFRDAAHIARNGCLVPPDGGSPTVAEAEMCERIADAILRLEVP